MLFAYNKRFDEALKRGQVYWPGESIKKFGLQIANIEPVMVADRDDRFEFGEVIALDSDGRARKIAENDAATVLYGVVHRNATATYSVLDEQVFGMAPRLTLSVFRGGRQGVIAVPVQNIVNFDGDTNPVTPVVSGAQVFVRVKPNTTNTALPIGGIETADSDGECVAWTGVTFAEPVSYPFKDERYTTTAGITTAVAGINLG